MKGVCSRLLILLGCLSVQERVNGAEENAALGGVTNQSTSFEGWYSEQAVDGMPSSCSQTLAQSSPWWRVDLVKLYRVNRVIITNINDKTSVGIKGAELRVGTSPDFIKNPICANISSILTGASSTYYCHGREGRYIHVVFPGDEKILTLCEVEVYGYLIGNLAIGRSVTQSSIFESWYAEQAIDGNRGLITAETSCSSTDLDDNPWWRLDLRHVYKISRVVVTNVVCCPDRINGTEIRVGNSLQNEGNSNPVCAVIPGIAPGESSTYACRGMEGRYLNLVLPEEMKMLTLCEVEVYGAGPCLKKSYVKLLFNSKANLTDSTNRKNILEELVLVLKNRGFSNVTLQWSKPPVPIKISKVPAANGF